MSEQKASRRKTERKPRIPVSCAPCRSRKLKCNRSQPCQNCTVRNKPSSCVYEASEQSRPTLARPAHAEDMQKRIDRLESLVTTLVAQGQGNSDAGKPSDNDNSPQSLISKPVLEDHQHFEAVQHRMGVMEVNDKHSIYRGSTHWGEILEELKELKGAWSQAQSLDANLQKPSYEATDGASILCGLPSPMSKTDLLASLPAKPALDKLIDTFFEDHESPPHSFHIIHQATFMKDYERHFSDPSKTEIVWLGLLFSMLSLVMLIHHNLGNEPPEYEGVTESLFELYRLRTAQCLMLGDITKCAPYTLETMLYNTLAEQARKDDGETRVWMMVGLLVRVALQMGYHRDPSHYPEITIFQGEMRRRVWAFVQGLDTLMAFLVGLPSSIRALDSDTQEPRNLYLWELSEDMTCLPPSRPNTEHTPVLYLLCKRHLLTAMAEIVHYLSSLKSYSNSRVLELDSALQDAYAQIPLHLLFHPHPYHLDNDPPSLYDMKTQLHFLYNQGMCILHRKFLSQPQSRERCIQSALSLLALQQNLYEYAKAKGEKAKRHWYRVSYVTHEFILAAMILVMDLRRRDEDENAPQRGEILDSLFKARLVWKAARDHSAMAMKVYTVLSNMLQSLSVAESTGIEPISTLPLESEFDAGQFVVPHGEEENIDFGTEMDIDWAVWDQFIEGASFEDAYGGTNTGF